MTELSLQDAFQVASRIKAGEQLPSVMVGNIEYFPRKTVKYLRGMANEIENTDLVVAANKKTPGVRNINSDTLEFPFMPTDIRMNFSTAASGLTPKTAKYTDEAPVYFRNGEIKIVQDVVMVELPISVLANGYAATSVKDDFFPVAPFLIRPSKAFQIQVGLAGTAAADAFSLEIEGIEFVRNTRA